ncbi:MAG: TetR family transcriptional regulator [Thermoleophilia bacterium]|nr:TetR family transcriptional regulator [Thermoleophilia bacterium]
MADMTSRMGTESRKQRIVKAALEAIGEYGIQGATISRIARGAGITPAALYSHFENRRAILTAALDAVYEQIIDSFTSSWSDDPIELFRQICAHHAQKVLSQDKTSHAHLFLEFVASAPEEGLREVLREKELQTSSHLASIVRRFQEQGRLSQDVDPEMIAWLIACWAWTGDVANLMESSSVWHEKVSSHLMKSILELLSQGPPAGAQDPDASGLPTQPAQASDLEKAEPAMDAAGCDGLPDGAVFTVEEAAGILKVSTDTIHEAVGRGQIASLSVGSETRIPRRTLVAFLRGMSDAEFDELCERRAARAGSAAV